MGPIPTLADWLDDLLPEYDADDISTPADVLSVDYTYE